MPGPCSRPPDGKTKYVRRNKNRGDTPKHGWPKGLKARIDAWGLVKNSQGGMNYNKPGSYKK